MKPFDLAFDHLMEIEGGYSNHNEDRGGATNHGITRETLSGWRREPVTIDDVKALTRAEAKRIYHVNYWSPMKLEEIGGVTSAVLFDQAVNRGTHQVAKELQRIIGGKNDGVIGNNTLYLCSTYGDKDLAYRLIKVAQKFYVNLCVKNPSQLVFLNGWLLRTHRLIDLLFSV